MIFPVPCAYTNIIADKIGAAMNGRNCQPTLRRLLAGLSDLLNLIQSAAHSMRDLQRLGCWIAQS